MKNRIEQIRAERGIRQEDFAKALGVSRQTISSLENGRYNPSIILKTPQEIFEYFVLKYYIQFLLLFYLWHFYIYAYLTAYPNKNTPYRYQT